MKIFLTFNDNLVILSNCLYNSFMRTILFLFITLGFSLSHADCISDALASANIDRSQSQVTTTPAPSDGSGNIKYQISVFGPLAGGAIVICSADNSTLVGFEAPFQFIGSN